MEKIKLINKLYEKVCVENKRLNAVIVEKEQKIRELEGLIKYKITTL
jgi:hypothetical protein